MENINIRNTDPFLRKLKIWIQFGENCQLWKKSNFLQFLILIKLCNLAIKQYLDLYLHKLHIKQSKLRFEKDQVI
jgi:hypothetical protein